MRFRTKRVIVLASVLAATGCPDASPSVSSAEDDAGQAVSSTEVAETASLEDSSPDQIKEDFRGSSHTIGVTADQSTTLHSFIARERKQTGSTGKQRYALVQSLLVADSQPTKDETKEPPEDMVDPRCPEYCGRYDETECEAIPPDQDQCPKCTYGFDVVSLTWVQTYIDGSAFTGAVARPDAEDPQFKDKFDTWRQSTFLCTNGTDFHLQASGRIVSGAGKRFEELSGGTWTATSNTVNYLTTGEFEANFTYPP